MNMNLSDESLDAFLHFLYNADIKMALQSSSITLDLLEIGQLYHIPSLENAMKEVVLGKSYEWFTLDNAVLLYLYAANVGSSYNEIRGETIKIIKM